jgi:ribose 1,5-bisphosphokinase PhnN
MNDIKIKEIVNLAAGDAVIFKINRDSLPEFRKHYRQVFEMLAEKNIAAIFIADDVEVDVFRKENNV